MKLYGHIVSPYVARVAFAARLKGLSLTPEPAPGGGIKSAEFLKLNPIGKMPAMEVDGHCIAESMVLLDYLEDAYPNPPLLPADALGRARARLLGRIVDLYVTASSRAFFVNMNPEKRNSEELEAGKAAYLKSLAQLEHFMGDGPYAVGNTLGYADIAILPCLQMMNLVAEPCGLTNAFNGLPKLTRWWAQMQSDPVAAGMVKEYATAFTGFMQSRR